MAYVVKTHFRALRAYGTREPKKVYDMIISILRRLQRATYDQIRSKRTQIVRTKHLLLYTFLSTKILLNFQNFNRPPNAKKSLQ